MSAPQRPAAGGAIVDYGQLMLLGPGDTIRFRTPKGPGLAIKNDDGTWSGTGVSETMLDHLLWLEISDVTLISKAPVMSAAGLGELLGTHLFVHDKDGDGWSERRTESFGCSCGRASYAFWVQENPDLPGQQEFRADRPVHEQAHAAHLAQVITPILEQAWDAGRDAGELQAGKPTRIDLAGDKNPYRDQPAPDISEVRYPTEPSRKLP